MKSLVKRMVALALVVVMATSLAVGLFVTSHGTAHASGSGGTGGTISVSSVQLVDRVGLNVTVTFSCSLPAGAYVFGNGFGGVSVAQAVGTAVSSAGTMITIAPSECDGQSHSLLVPLTLTNTVMHPGPAVASASFYVQYFDFTTFTSSSVGATVTNVPVRISA